jgi:hypothetical protein
MTTPKAILSVEQARKILKRRADFANVPDAEIIALLELMEDVSWWLLEKND